MKRFLVLLMSVLLVLLLSFLSYELIFQYRTVLSEDDVAISSVSASDNLLKVTVKVNTIGVYAYSMSTKSDGDDLIIGFLGGKQPSLSADGENGRPTFEVSIPSGIKNIVFNDDVILVVSE